MRNTERKHLLILAVAVGLLFVLGCGGSGGGRSNSDAGGDAGGDAAGDDAGPDAEAPATFATCNDVREAAIAETGKAPSDGTYTLYVGGDATKPWDAFCRGMNHAAPKEYLSVNEALNVSQIGNGIGVVQTSYRRLRIDPVTLEIDPLDATFATTDGGDSVNVAFPIEASPHVPAGWAEFQPTRADDGPSAKANVSLDGTPFVFSETILANNLADFFCTVSENSVDGDDASSGASVTSDLQAFRLEAINSNSASTDDSNARTREVADCAHLGPGSDFTVAAWPLQYAGD